MACEDKQKAFNEKFAEVQAVLQAELTAIATDTEARAKEIADDFEKDNGLAAGVGAVAGTAIGGLAGPGGAAVGGMIGKTIGSLFTLEVGMHRETFSLDIPETRMETRDFSFDLPSVVMRDNDISFDAPTTEMRRVEGPPIPKITVRMETECHLGVCFDVPKTVVEWEPSYYDAPVVVMKTQRIVIGLPQVEMRRQEIKMDVPSISMKTTEFSADIPYITLRFIQDAGKRTAALAAALAQSAQEAAVQKQLAYKQRIRLEVAPLALDMFACYKAQITQGRSTVLSQFSPQIQTLQNAVTALVAKGVPEDNADLQQAKAQLSTAIEQQATALRPLDEALAKLEESSRNALQQMLGEGKGISPATGAARTFPMGNSIPGLVQYSAKGARQGLYLTIGLNSIDPAAYGGPGTLTACENDARDLANIAQKAGFTGTTLLTQQATSRAVLTELMKAASTLEAGDVLLLSYSGHGGQTGDITGDEDDSLDETWCLYDRQLLDDELYAMWAKFKPGVRIVVLSDSCHSGTVTKDIFKATYKKPLSTESLSDMSLAFELSDANLQKQAGGSSGKVKGIPFQRAWANYTQNKAMYDSLQIIAGPRKQLVSGMGASVILISGCQDKELSLDGPVNGEFTRSLKEVWANGQFAGNYKDFWKAIARNGMPPDQNPNYLVVGRANLEFEAQRPFTI